MVLCGPYSLGASRQRRPFLITKTMPLTIRRSSTRAIPCESGKYCSIRRIQMLFDADQTKLDENLSHRRRKRAVSEALLLRRIFDDRGNRMTPNYAVKQGAQYPYYVSCVLARGRKEEAGPLSRIPAPDIEAAIDVRGGRGGGALIIPAGNEPPEDFAAATIEINSLHQNNRYGARGAWIVNDPKGPGYLRRRSSDAPPPPC